jgi:hypothetical protein
VLKLHESMDKNNLKQSTEREKKSQVSIYWNLP